MKEENLAGSTSTSSRPSHYAIALLCYPVLARLRRFGGFGAHPSHDSRVRSPGLPAVARFRDSSASEGWWA